MNKWTEYNPENGIVETNEVDEMTGALITHKTQDCTGAVDYLKELANTGAKDGGIKKDLWHYCSIPIGVQYEMLWKHGVDISKRDHWPRLFDLVNKEYPHLKTTHKVHAFKGGSSRIYTRPN